MEGEEWIKRWVYVQEVLDIVTDPKWNWGLNSKCKYLNIRLDTRDTRCYLEDRYGNYITLEELAYQHGNEDEQRV